MAQGSLGDFCILCQAFPSGSLKGAGQILLAVSSLLAALCHSQLQFSGPREQMGCAHTEPKPPLIARWQPPVTHSRISFFFLFASGFRLVGVFCCLVVFVAHEF